MPSFDVVSEVNIHEVTNAVDQANREVANRFDFKGSNARYELNEYVVTLSAENDFQLRQMLDILRTKLSKRGVDIACLLEGKPEISGNRARQSVTLRHGIEADLARRMVRMIKDTKLKVQASIQDEKVRVTGKKKDELQEVIALLRNSNFGLPLQFVNFRD
ncbi:MAG TPA: YajQ family cyclic di-GMP-binding protein [Thermodesulfobacteriota bacterium]|nr:YajQ family cyclic di-GMP-binding protein [Thermodesulfobacteriota bacterium]